MDILTQATSIVLNHADPLALLPPEGRPESIVSTGIIGECVYCNDGSIEFRLLGKSTRAPDGHRYIADPSYVPVLVASCQLGYNLKLTSELSASGTHLRVKAAAVTSRYMV